MPQAGPVAQFPATPSQFANYAPPRYPTATAMAPRPAAPPQVSSYAPPVHIRPQPKSSKPTVNLSDQSLVASANRGANIPTPIPRPAQKQRYPNQAVTVGLQDRIAQAFRNTTTVDQAGSQRSNSAIPQRLERPEDMYARRMVARQAQPREGGIHRQPGPAQLV